MPETLNFIKKETLAQVFSCKFSEISKNTFFKEPLWWLLGNIIFVHIHPQSQTQNPVEYFRKKSYMFDQKQPSEGNLRKSCSENMQQTYRRTPMSKCVSIKLQSNFIEITFGMGVLL